MLIVVLSQGKQQAALKGPKGASSANQWGGLWSKNQQDREKWGRNSLHVIWSCPAVHVVSSCNPTAILLWFFTTSSI